MEVSARRTGYTFSKAQRETPYPVRLLHLPSGYFTPGGIFMWQDLWCGNKAPAHNAIDPPNRKEHLAAWVEAGTVIWYRGQYWISENAGLEVERGMMFLGKTEFYNRRKLALRIRDRDLSKCMCHAQEWLVLRPKGTSLPQFDRLRDDIIEADRRRTEREGRYREVEQEIYDE